MAGALGCETSLVRVTTAGDRGEAGGDKSRWVAEIEQALLAGEADLAVHSAKDVPGELAEGLSIAGVPVRADPRDAICGAPSLEALADGAVVATSSLRRRSQLLAVRPDLDIRDVRGNVDTRLRKLAEGQFDAVVLAVAGLERLGRADEGSALGVELLCPAAGQGCLALEARVDDAVVRELAEAVTDRAALVELTAERAVVAALDATCHTPVGAYAVCSGSDLSLSAYVGLPDGSSWIRDQIEGSADDPAALGRALAERLQAVGATELLAAAEAS